MVSLFPEPGPSLPKFKTLLITGPYHASAPIHLCLSHIASNSNSRAILFTPSRQWFKDALVELNDEWLTTNSGCGKVHALSSKVTVFYPQTPTHLLLLLSHLQVSSSKDITPTTPKAILEGRPSLLVMHQPSLYFPVEDSHLYTVSSYLTLITHALAALSFLFSSGVTESPSFVLFDSQLDRMKFPVLHSPSRVEIASPPRLESVILFVEKYFEWKGTFERDLTHKWEIEREERMKLWRIGSNNITEWIWVATCKGEEDPRKTTFTWLERP